MATLDKKKILITAGPVWVPIDSVRIMTNIFKGTLGIKIAQECARRGAIVTLLLGPTAVSLPEETPLITIDRFKFFDELYQKMERLVSGKQFDAVFHSAAVADYLPKKIYQGKIKSGKESLAIEFQPTVKIVDLIKRWDPDIFLVKFKLEVGLDRESLIDKAYQSMLDSKAELIVANDFNDISESAHAAYIIDAEKKITSCDSKDDIAKKLVATISRVL